MTFFDLDISEKDLAAATYVTRLQRHLIRQFIRKGRAQKVTKAEIARKLEVDKSTVSRMLNGNANLTARTVGELCWALGLEPVFSTIDLDAAAPGQNIHTGAGDAVEVAPGTVTFHLGRQLAYTPKTTQLVPVRNAT